MLSQSGRQQRSVPARRAYSYSVTSPVVSRVTAAALAVRIAAPPVLIRGRARCAVRCKPASWRPVRVVQASQGHGTGRPESGVGRSGCCTLVLHRFRGFELAVLACEFAALSPTRFQAQSSLEVVRGPSFLSSTSRLAAAHPRKRAAAKPPPKGLSLCPVSERAGVRGSAPGNDRREVFCFAASFYLNLFGPFCSPLISIR
jgi:hypothetical protein